MVKQIKLGHIYKSNDRLGLFPPYIILIQRTKKAHLRNATYKFFNIQLGEVDVGFIKENDFKAIYEELDGYQTT